MQGSRAVTGAGCVQPCSCVSNTGHDSLRVCPCRDRGRGAGGNRDAREHTPLRRCCHLRAYPLPRRSRGTPPPAPVLSSVCFGSPISTPRGVFCPKVDGFVPGKQACQLENSPVAIGARTTASTRPIPYRADLEVKGPCPEHHSPPVSKRPPCLRATVQIDSANARQFADAALGLLDGRLCTVA